MKGGGVPSSIPLSFRSRESFRIAVLLGFIWLVVFVGFEAIFYPPRITFFLAVPAILYLVIFGWISKRCSPYLIVNLYLLACVTVLTAFYWIVMFFGACYRVTDADSFAFPVSLFLGFVSFGLSFSDAYMACSRLHHTQERKRTRSMDWDTGVYDMELHSLEQVDMEGAIMRESPAIWKLVLYATLGLSPGPALSILAGKISNVILYAVLLVAAWVGSIMFGSAAVKHVFNAIIVRKMEGEHGIHLRLSTALAAEEQAAAS